MAPRAMMRAAAAAALALWCGVAAAEPAPARAKPAEVAPCKDEDGRQVCAARCDGGSQASCAALGLMYLRGDGGKADYPKAKALLGAACTAGVAVGCGGLGSLVGEIEKDFARARPLLEQGCKGGDPLSCESLGGIEVGLDGHKVADLAAASRRAGGYYRRACELGSGPGCAFAAAMIEDGTIKGTLREALDAYVKACGRGVALACRMGARSLNKDTPAWRQLAATLDAVRLTEDLLDHGCKAGDPAACELKAKPAAARWPHPPSPPPTSPPP